MKLDHTIWDQVRELSLEVKRISSALQAPLKVTTSAKGRGKAADEK